MGAGQRYRSTTFFLSLICLSAFTCHCATGTFFAAPENVTVYSGETARFNCQVSQAGLSGLLWLIEDLQPSRLQDFYQARSWDPEEVYNPDISSIALQLIGISETNNTSVKCVTVYTYWEYSDTVYLKVQGILDAPKNLASSVINDSVLITWTPPSTLPGTTTSFEVNASVGDLSEHFSTSQHNFLIGLCDLGVSACYSNCELSVSVRSINQAGEGEPAYITVPVQPFSCDGAEHDMLGPPMDLVASATDDSLSVSWSRPSSSHPISHYSVNVWDTQTEFLIANGIKVTDLKYTRKYMTVGIDTCNRSYNFKISVCGVNVAGKGETANTTMAIQQDMQSCPTTSDFQRCSPSEVKTFSIGDEVSSLCRLHTSTSHADNLVISYHTGGRKESSTTVDQTLCHQVQSSMLDFDLVVLRPNDTNSNREARIFIFNVREETSLEVICTARQRDGLRMVPVSNNTLMIEFILIVKSVTTPQTSTSQTSTSTHSPHNFSQDPVLMACVITAVVLLIMIVAVTVAIIGACMCVKRRNKIDDYSKQPSIHTGQNPSYGDAPPLTKNPCYEEPPHLYESIDPVYSTVTVKVQLHPKGIASRVYPAHESA